MKCKAALTRILVFISLSFYSLLVSKKKEKEKVITSAACMLVITRYEIQGHITA